MEIAVISGKGGTGKSTISAAFATLSEKVVLADCDVDAANMYILFNPTHEEEQVYVGRQKAVIDYSLCKNCGLCINYCRFDAISFINGKVAISEISCDGCKLCTRICPAKAISMVDSDKSRMYSGTFRNGKMVYGRLAPGEENSGKLVNIIRDKAKQISKENNLNTIIIDGPPGIGCPVISTITGVDHVVVVTEPTLSGMHDLQRTIEITSKFNLKTWVIINKYDLNLEITQKIKNWCEKQNVSIAGELPFDEQVVNALVNCQSIVEFLPDSDLSKLISLIWKKILESG
ncbi:MAG: ATP-binding protein, partial [Bacteroidales bacterium]